MAKSILTKKELPFLNRDLELDGAILERLKGLQDEFKAKFDDSIKASGKEALSRYELKIKTLNEAKEKILREYDAEINTYQAIVKEMKGRTR